MIDFALVYPCHCNGPILFLALLMKAVLPALNLSVFADKSACMESLLCHFRCH